MAVPYIDQRAAIPVVGIRGAVLKWYAGHGRDLPWRGVRDPYAIAVSEVMLQQTQVERVEPKYREFLARFPTWEALASAGLGQVLRVWAPLGYNGRAVRLHQLAQWVVAHGGRLPSDEHALRALPGVGTYTASALAAFAFGHLTTVIDTNVRRVLARALLGEPYASPAIDRRLRPLARDLVPTEAPGQWHEALMDLGATVCTTRRPACSACPLTDVCLARPIVMDGVPPRRGTPGEVFRGSRRYYRGRFLAELRGLPDGEVLPLDDLGPRLRPDYKPGQAPWLRDLARRLVADGLVRYDVEAETVGLP